MKWADTHEEDGGLEPDWDEHVPVPEFSVKEGPNAALAAWEADNKNKHQGVQQV